MMKTDYLKIIFFKRLSKYTDNKKLINDTFADLLNDYTGEKRHYHDLTHVVDLLNLLEANKFLIGDDDVIFFAIWFHDAIYNTWKTNNEEKSAEMAQNVLSKTSMPPSRIEKVVNYIMATKTHVSNNDNDLNFFLDFDLSILGADEVIYEVYTRQIREEYNSFISFNYSRGRKKMLKSLLEREFIYNTPVFREKLEAKARENMEKELTIL